jgi:hypothetical protein
MGIDVEFLVYCQKVSKITHKFTTSTPWKEMKEFTKQGYKIVRSNSEEATLEKVKSLNDAPTIHYNNRLSFFEKIQNLYQSHHAHYKPWCKWDFTEYNRLTSKKDFQSTLQVWEDLWNDIFTIIKENDSYDNSYDTYLAEIVHSKMREILQYALDNEDIYIHTHIKIDY